MVEPIFDYQFRLILIGDSTVGKSSLLKYFTDGKFSEVSDPTVGVDFFARLVQVQDGTRVKLQLWDTAGQERFRSITKSYYRNSVGALLVYDTTNHDSFERIPNWMEEARRHIAPFKPVFILVGCKSDLPESAVTSEEVNRLTVNCDIKSIITSAKTGDNVEEAFRLITEEIYAKLKLGEFRADDENWDGIKRGFNGSGSGGGPLLMGEQVSKCC
ncbi:unnamed protein product [Allacma fusca]|uniref:Ras-related protein Rab-39B n=2 Tax=Allacma fusca TaxID=39272 RepID=A0A8J2LJ27_9HEXA|nr:unnamed protein product [Allacma fusca]